MASLAVDPVSPELALVCPDLRARAIALLDEREAAAARTVADATAPPSSPPVWLCAVAYASLSLALVVAQGVSAVSALVLLLTLLAG